MPSFIQSVAGMQYPTVFVQNCTNPNRFNLGSDHACRVDGVFCIGTTKLQGFGNTVDLNTSVEANNAGLQFFYDPRQIGA